MFRIIQSYIDPATGPEYFLLCDNRSCAYTARGLAQLATQTSIKESQQAFVSAATRDGWLIGLDAQLCPGHADQQRQALAQKQEKDKSGLLSPNMAQINRLGKSRPS